jgi:putative membrane protein
MAAVLHKETMIDLISLGVLGVFLGAFTGVIPGLHPNTLIFGSIPVYLGSGFEFMSYAALISGLSISHTFHDFLPSIYMQAPEANTALSSLPGAEMAAAGKGPQAFRATLAGGVVSIIVLLLSLPLLMNLLADLYNLMAPFMAYIVGFFLLFPHLPRSFSTSSCNRVYIRHLRSGLAKQSFERPIYTDACFFGPVRCPSCFIFYDQRFRTT